MCKWISTPDVRQRPTLPRLARTECKEEQQPVSISSAAPQLNKHHVDTFICRTANGSVPDRNFPCSIAVCVQQKKVLDHCPKCFRYFSAVLQAGVSPNQNFFCRVEDWGNEVRTHAVAVNGGSTKSDGDVVASFRLARVGSLLQKHVTHIFPTFQKEKHTTVQICSSLFFSSLHMWSSSFQVSYFFYVFACLFKHDHTLLLSFPFSRFLSFSCLEVFRSVSCPLICLPCPSRACSFSSLRFSFLSFVFTFPSSFLILHPFF